MPKHRWVTVAIVVVALGLSALLVLNWESARSDIERASVEPSPELERRIHAATQKVLPSGGYMLFIQESAKCRGATAIKTAGADWGLGLAWYDSATGEVTDVITRDELRQLMAQYAEVDSYALRAVRRSEKGIPEIPVGLLKNSGESVWLQLDPDSCGVRSGWLVYRALPAGKVTRQKIRW